MLLSTGTESLAVGVAPRVDAPCPASIDNTGASDVTAALTAWLCSLPAGSQAVFDGSYRVDGTIELAKRSGLLVSGGSFFTDVATTSRTRSFMDIAGCTNVGLENVTFRGPNAQAGTSDAAYVASLEAQHFVNVAGGSTGVFVRGCHASMIYGDFVYVGGGSSYVVVTGNDFHNNGRQCFSVCNGNHVWLVDNTVDQLRRAFVDLEPATNDWHVNNVVVARNTVGAHRLLALAAGSALGTVDDVWFCDNIGSGAGDIVVHGAPYNRWTFTGNRMGSWGGPAGMSAWNFTNVQGLTVVGNYQPLQAGRGDWFCKLTNCTDYTVHGNEFPGAVGEVSVA